jgi:hypothetical protein
LRAGRLNNSRVARNVNIRRYAVAAVVFGLALTLSFHAILLNPNGRVAYGLADGTSTIRDYWAAAAQHRTPFSYTHDILDGAPQGIIRAPATTVANGGIQAAFIWELRGLFGLIGAWNAFMLFGLFATALAMFAFLDRLGCSFAASLIGGYAFGFSPFALERAYAGHLALLNNWVFPLLAGLLLRLRSRGTLASAAAVGVAIAVAFYLSAYQGLFAAFMTFVFLVVEVVRDRRAFLKTFALGSATALIGLLALTPILVLFAQQHATVDETTSHQAKNFYQFAATWSGYLLPDARNPLFHWLSGVNPDPTEDTLFWGYATLLLALSGVVLIVRRDPWIRARASRWSTGIFAIALIPPAFLMSLPPSYQLGPVRVPLPSTLLGDITTFWRSYSRFGLLVGFALVTLAALALTSLSRRPGRWRYLTPAAAIVIFLELLPGNLHTFNATARPQWVTWLARQPRGIVVTFPWIFGQTLTLDNWYQLYDRDPQFAAPQMTGYDGGLRLLARDLWRPLTARVLATEGVRYVVVHEDAYRAAGQGTIIPNPKQYTLLRQFGAVGIYSVHAPKVNILAALRENAAVVGQLQELSSPSVTYGSGFNASEQYLGETSRWMIQDGQLQVSSAETSDVILKGLAFSNQQPRELELTNTKGEVVARARVATSSTAVSFGPFRVGAGTTTLTLIATPGPEILGPTDPREASVFIEPLSIANLPPYLTYPSSTKK